MIFDYFIIFIIFNYLFVLHVLIVEMFVCYQM